MGDRANIVFNTTGISPGTTLDQAMQGSIVLYSHWGGSELGSDLRKALTAAKPRWSDPSYATRIIVSQVVGKDWTQETGFGLSVGELCDNEHSVLVVDFANRQVGVYGPLEGSLRLMPFSNFIALSDAAANEFHEPDNGDAD